MATYIKVTPKGDTKSHIVLATLTDFYISQGAKIEEPTQEEVYAAVPQERPARAAAPQEPRTDHVAIIAQQKEDIKGLRHAIDVLDQDIKTKDETIKQQVCSH